MSASSGIDLHGLWVPIVTPFDEKLEVDVDGLARLAGRILDDGATGLVVLGTTGEPATLTAEERELVVATCAGVCREQGRSFIVGAGSNSTWATVDEVARWATLAPDAAAVLVVVPYYTRPLEQGVVEHFRAVAAASPLPVVVYNIPYRTGRGLGADSLVELAATPGIVGVKQAVGALDRDTLAVLLDAPDGFHVLAGDDAFVAPVVLMGGAGAIAASANVATSLFVELVAAGIAGDIATTQRLAADLLAVVDAGFAEPSPAVFKAALHARGEIATPSVRAPLTPASPSATEAIRAALGPVLR